jgi:hypothetical protein
MKSHLSEILLDMKLRGEADRFRKRHPFSENMEATQAILFNPQHSKLRKVTAYRHWLENNQPCVFGKVAAKNQNVFICLLEEQEILRMGRGDEDIRDTIQDYRQVWKRYALEGRVSSFLIVLVSKSLVHKEPDERLKEISRRLLELYMEVDRIEDDSILPQREYVFLRSPTSEDTSRVLKFSTLPNIFCAQADGRWWQDHRTPGGIMITSNALGHFVYSRAKKPVLEDKDKVWALENAMRTIGNAYAGNRRSRSVRLCPATYLIPIPEGETSPLRETSEFRKYSPDHYEGYFHTDHLIPSVFFEKESNLKEAKHYDNLTFRYIFDAQADPKDHAELMTGIEATWYDVRRNMDRLPDFANPEKQEELSDKFRGKLKNWLESRLKARIEQ